MPKAKPLKDDAPQAHLHEELRKEQFGVCALCGGPIEMGQTAQPMAPEQEGGAIGRAHVTCFHERAMTRRAMQRPQ